MVTYCFTLSVEYVLYIIIFHIFQDEKKKEEDEKRPEFMKVKLKNNQAVASS